MIRRYALYDADGTIQQTATLDESDISGLAAALCLAAVEVALEVGHETHRISDGVPVLISSSEAA